MTTPTALVVLIAGHRAGMLHKLRGNRLSFVYDEAWRTAPAAIPLSLSMPLVAAEHGHATVSAFLWNLLPDNAQVLEAWARRYQVSAASPFNLLVHVGADVAGALQFLPPDRLDEAARGSLEPLSDEDIATRLAELRQDPALGRRPSDHGQFSLGGAQTKTALRKTIDGWALPTGSEPTTHIFKPPRPELNGHVENEHFCLRLADKLGLPTPQTRVMRFRDELAIVVTRYDRVLRGEHYLRVHQEDMCQVHAVPPATKYESDGGPGIAAIMQALAGSGAPEEDRSRFMLAVAFNVLVGGTDAHAKNYSILLAPGGRYRLAPLYDIASALPYAGRRRDLGLAMAIGGHRVIYEIMPRHFEATARACRYPAERFREQVAECAGALPDLAATTVRECRADGIDQPVLDALVDAIARQCAVTLRRFGVGGQP